MIRLKAGVRPLGVRTEIILAMLVTESVFRDQGVEFVITSLCDGTHSRGSLHYVGAAFDCRTSEIAPESRKAVAHEIRNRLGGDYDVVLETTHLHIEYQPKEAY